MITTKKLKSDFGVEFTNGNDKGLADATSEKGGNGDGFRPHDLLEASLAVCLNITVQMYAKKHGISAEDIETTVELDRKEDGVATFRYELNFPDGISELERGQLLRMASNCPVRQTLSRTIKFSYIDPKGDA